MKNEDLEQQDILTQEIAKIASDFSKDLPLASFYIKLFVSKDEDQLNIAKKLLADNSFQNQLKSFIRIKEICDQDSSLKEFALNLANELIEIQAARDAIEGSKSVFVDEITKQRNARLNSNQKH